MRSSIAKFAFAVFAASASSTLAAQSLEETYAKMCSDGAKAKSEACQILAKSLVAKIQSQQTVPTSTAANAGPDAATQALWRKRWGHGVDFMGKEYFHVYDASMSMDTRLAALKIRYKSDWLVPGEKMRTTMNIGDGVWHDLGTGQWDEANQRVAHTAPPPLDTVSYTSASADGVTTPETTHAGVTSRSTTRQISPGQTETVLEVKKDGVWAESMRMTTLVASPEIVAREQQRIQLEQQRAAQQIADLQQQERDEKRAQSQQRGQMFNSVMQGLAQGLSESGTGGYAEAQANADAIVADIQHAADVERQQQALAAQQAQARAAEEQRHQLAANARWVAEKEQAAAEYRSGQVDAVAARESKMLAQQQADQQRRAAAAAESRNIEQAAALKRQQAQAAALAERPTIAAQPVAVGRSTDTAASSNKASQAPSGQSASGGSIQLYVFFIVHGGRTVAFEGPLALTVAESKAMEVRLNGEAPGKYGAGATVDRRWRGPGTCLFVYQLPGEALYQLGSGNGAADAEKSRNAQVSNGKATLLRDVACIGNT